MDWVPMVNYGSTVLVNPGTLYMLLYPIPDFAAGDSEFLIEDEEEAGLFPLRIVGDIVLSWQTMPFAGRVSWRLMPMGVNYESLDVLPPYTDIWRPDSPEWANLRWWDERDYVSTIVGSVDGMPSTVDHPYWTRVDISPRQQLGSKVNLWPVLAIHNSEGEARMQVRHRLRCLWR